MKAKIISLLLVLSLLLCGTVVLVQATGESGVSILDASANAIVRDTGYELQVTVNATADGDIAEYGLYKRTSSSDAWESLSTSRYPVIIYGSYDESAEYAVTATDTDGNRSDYFVIENVNVGTGEENLGEFSENILSGLTFTAAINEQMWYNNPERLTDATYKDVTDTLIGSGSSETRYATLNSTTVGLDVYVELASESVLHELRIKDYNGWGKSANYAGNKMKVQVLLFGEWVDIYDYSTNADILKHRKQYNNSNFLIFDMNDVRAEGIRVVISERYLSNYISLEEIECSATPIAEESDVTVPDLTLPYSPTNLLSGLTFKSEINEQMWYNYTERLTDGDYWNGSNQNISGVQSEVRYATLNSSTLGMSLKVELEGVAMLTELRIKDHSGWSSSANYAGAQMEISVLHNGVWSVIYDLADNASILAHRKVYNSCNFLIFDMSGIKAEAIRVYIPTRNGTNYIALEEIECSGFYTNYLGGDIMTTEYDNILLNKSFVAAINEQMWYNNPERLTDGDYWNGSNQNISGVQSEVRYATLNSSTVGIDISADLGTFAKLNQLRIKDHNGWSSSADCAGNAMTIQVKQDGEWVSVYDYTSNAEILKHRKAYNGCNFLIFDMNGVYAEAIRIVIPERYGSNYIALQEIECSATAITTSDTVTEDEDSNVLLGTTADKLSVENGTIHSSVPDLTKAFDGNVTDASRYATHDTDGSYSLVIDLGEATPLFTLRVYDWRGALTATRSDKTTVELYNGGTWITVAKDVSLSFKEKYTDFNLYGLLASKIRITFTNTSDVTEASINEITCTTAVGFGVVDNGNAVDRAELLESYVQYEREAALTGADTSIYLAYLTDTKATIKDVEYYVLKCDEALNALGELKAPSSDLPTVNVGGTEVSADFAYQNLELRGSVQVNLYTNFGKALIEQYPDAYAVYVNSASNRIGTVRIDELPYDSERDRYTLSIALASVNMKDTLSVRLFLDADTAGKVRSTSVYDYCSLLLDNSDYSAEHALLTAMLNYGAYAQSYFGYNSDDLASEGIAAPDLSGVDAAVNIEKHKTSTTVADGTNLAVTGWYLALESRTEAKINFSLGGADISDYNLTVTAEDGSAAPFTVEENGTGYLLTVTDIYGLNLDKTYTVSLESKANGGVSTLSFTALAYVNSVLNGTASETASKELKDLCRAIKLYSDASVAYAALTERTYTVTAEPYENLKRFLHFVDESGNILTTDTTYTYTASAPKTVTPVYGDFLDVDISLNTTTATAYDATTYTISNMHWYNTSYITTPLRKGMTVEFTMYKSADQFVLGLATAEEIANQTSYSFSSSLPYLFAPAINYYYSSGDNIALESLVAGAGAAGKLTDYKADPTVDYVAGSTELNTYRFVLDDTLLLYINGELVDTTLSFDIADGTDYYFSAAAMSTSLTVTDFGYDYYISNRGSFDLASLTSLPISESDLVGKKITFLGDSITYGIGVDYNTDRYTTVLTNGAGMVEHNMGISGSVMCTRPDGAGRINQIQYISDIPMDSDYVVILLGINDFDNCVAGDDGYYSLGSFGNGDTNTIYGAAEAIYSALVNRFRNTDTKIYICTPVITSWNHSVTTELDWSQDKTNACGYTLRDLCLAQIEVAEYYGLNVIDLNATSGLTADDFTDGIHPNASGMAKIADKILEELLRNSSYNL